VIFEAEALRNRARRGGIVGIVPLTEVSQPAIVAKVLRLQLRMTIEAETSKHQPLEVPHQKVGEEERSRLALSELGETFGARVELVAVHALDAFDAALAQHRIERPTRTAIGVGNKNFLVEIALGFDRCPHRRRDALGTVVQLRGQTVHIE